MQDILKIGLVVKPQGVKGELKVSPLTDDVARFKKLKSVLIDGCAYKVLGARPSIDAVFLSIEGICDRNTAETFRGKFLCVKREDAVILPKDKYFIADLEKCEVYTETQKIGKVLSLTQANTDYFTVQTVDKRVLRFPFLKDAVISIDIENKVITLKEKRLKEIGVYED